MNTRARKIKRLGRHGLARSFAVPFALLGAAARLAGPDPATFRPEQVRRVLLIRFDLLGDVVLTVPAVRAVRHTYPNARITWLVLPYARPVAESCPYVDDVLTFDVHRLRPSGNLADPLEYAAAWDLVRRLRRDRYDLAMSFHGLWGSVVAVLSGARWRAGYAGESYPLTLNLALPGRRYQHRRHEADYCLDLARAVGAVVDDRSLELPVEPAAASRTAAMLEAAGCGGEGSLVGIHVGASNGSAKQWAPEGWAAIADRVIAAGRRVVMTGAASEIDLVRDVVARMRREPIVLAGRTSIPELVALIDRCDLFLSGDSGPMHIAVARGVPTVAVHGPSDPQLSGPYGGNAIVVRRDLSCSPCYDLTDSAECPLGHHRCMRDLGPDEIWRAIEHQLERSHGSAN